MIARFYFSDGSFEEILELQSPIGLTKTIAGKLERPIAVQFVHQVRDRIRDEWENECKLAINGRRIANPRCGGSTPPDASG